VWSALGGELKPSLDLVVVAPFDYRREIEFGPPVLEGPQLAVVPAAETEPPKRARRSRKSGADDADTGADAKAAAKAGHGRDTTEPAATAGTATHERRWPEEERTGARHGHPGRRLLIKEIPAEERRR
jgi:hypothetical protein